MAISDHVPEFFRSLGQALVAWQDIEDALFYATYRILDTHPHYASIIFFHIKSPDAKVQLVDSLVRECFSDAGSAAWVPIFKKLKDLVQDRNRLAHHTAMVDIYAKNEDYLLHPRLRDPYLRFAAVHQKGKPKSYGTKELKDITRRFCDTAKEINAFLLSKFPDASLPDKHHPRDTLLLSAISAKIRSQAE